MRFLPFPSDESAPGSTAGRGDQESQFELCRAAASSGESIIDAWQSCERVQPVRSYSETAGDDAAATLHAHATQLLRECDFSALDNAALRDIVMRDHIYTIATYLRGNPTTPFFAELQSALAVLRAQVGIL